MSGREEPAPGVMDAALALIRQYGDDAEVIAVMRAAEVAALGDAAALAHWDAVILCISGLQGAGDPTRRH